MALSPLQEGLYSLTVLSGLTDTSADTPVDDPYLIGMTADIEKLAAAERSRPFDFERVPAIRFLLIELPDERWHLVITAHHIVIDGWSLPVFAAEMIALYGAGGDPAALPTQPRPYRDYIGWLAGRDRTP